jgi:hypothetical protein
MQTNGANYDVMPEDIAKWFDALEKDEAFTHRRGVRLVRGPLSSPSRTHVH